MPYKACSSCGRSSYSASDRGMWICPYCEKDITFVKSTFSQPNETSKILAGHLRLVKSQHS